MMRSWRVRLVRGMVLPLAAAIAIPGVVFAQAPMSAAGGPPSLVTSGQGEAKVNPDRVSVLVNVQTRAADSYEAHPLRRYFDAGMNVVLNTDNRLMSGTTLTDEYVHAAEQLDFSFDELCTVARNGFESAFLSDGERATLIASAKADMDALRTGNR